HRNNFAARTDAVPGQIIAQHQVDALERDIGDTAVERHRLRIEPAARGDRSTIRPEQRRGLDIGKSRHVAALVANATGEPGALVADRNEALTLAIEPQGREPAETGEAR